MLQKATVGSSFTETRRWSVIATLLLFLGGLLTYQLWRYQTTQTAANQTTEVSQPVSKTVTSLGRLEPKGEVIKLSAPTSNNGNRVEQLLVQEGDRITAGQVIAILDSHDRLQASLDKAQEDVRLAQANLAITQAGAKQGEIEAQRAEIVRLRAQRHGDIEAQKATIERLDSQLRNAEREFNRYQLLYQEGGISASDLDSRRLTLETAQKNLQEAKAILARIESTSPAQLNQATATLERIAQVRPVDVKANQVEVDRALAGWNQAKAELEQAYVKSPIDGEILDIHTRAGEVVSSDGIVEIGQTQQMYAIAEVYQSDISKVKPGQQVQISSDSLAGQLSGTVEWIDAQVRRQQVINTDPTTNTDARVIEVHIALDAQSSQKAAKLTNLQVMVVIEQ
ncbi:HlyD family efflux transporter periplasmic adaptor subunit [Lyngbya aestuarii]|uniref:HlyD family efflux transporter periplasmic adaptor subunit n=1 Tax=Lyngbya aestuarii TaxID=118322 RepID=UPI00403D5AF7